MIYVVNKLYKYIGSEQFAGMVFEVEDKIFERLKLKDTIFIMEVDMDNKIIKGLYKNKVGIIKFAMDMDDIKLYLDYVGNMYLDALSESGYFSEQNIVNRFNNNFSLI